MEKCSGNPIKVNFPNRCQPLLATTQTAFHHICQCFVIHSLSDVWCVVLECSFNTTVRCKFKWLRFARNEQYSMVVIFVFHSDACIETMSERKILKQPWCRRIYFDTALLSIVPWINYLCQPTSNPPLEPIFPDWQFSFCGYYNVDVHGIPF